MIPTLEILSTQTKISSNVQFREKIERVLQRIKILARNSICQKDREAKPIFLKEEYWLEAAHPTHYYGGYIYPMLQLWKNWDTQLPFFEWRQEVGKQLIIDKNERAIGFLHSYWENSIYISIEGFEKWLNNLVNPITVVYLYKAVQDYLITFDEGGKLFQNQQLLDTTGERYIFILDTSLNLYGCRYFPGKWHHSTLSKGGAILAGGGLDAQSGKILCIDDKCGHYDDGNQVDQAEKSIRYFLKFLLNNNADLSQTNLKINIRPHAKYQAFCLKALDFLQDNYIDQTWYVGALSREKALEKLKDTSFVVRQSENPVPLSQRKTINGHATVTIRAPCFEIIYCQNGKNEPEFIPVYKDGLDPFTLLDLQSQFLTDLIRTWTETKKIQTEIDKLDIENESKQQLCSLLSQFHRKRERGLDQFLIERVPHGHSHTNFYVQINGAAYFLKLAHPSKKSFLNDEYNTIQQLHEKNIKFKIPIPIEFICNNHAILVFEQIPGTNWQFSEQDLLERIIPELQKIHSTVVQTEKELDPIRLVLEALERTRLVGPDDILLIRDKLQPYLAGLNKVFCHNDLHSGNLLSATNGELYIIDWETAAYNYYLFDLAIIASHHQLPLNQMKSMLFCYKPSTEKEFEMLLLARTVVDLYYHLWCIERFPICDQKDSLKYYAKIYLDSYKRHLELSRSRGLI